ncbi:7TM diverse intracellular signaling domain-containing protein [Mucilaginibacter sp. KACC 22063]|uniref:7TM diverse intracellular signaling domain-containing protein n=1 Tax=Mucilaginibacter sp. KACC 22063 TaxID=3025666 RepID=UPI002365FE44|nr:7TM diverse intracellular signaling domain-containing protein [Mucilaginibacter sp. KACC 22063]WDF53775.1 7TM diverse intracellular signaling domain-containing protein [Mucilaginibacter sp. KACC 22063]
MVKRLRCLFFFLLILTTAHAQQIVNIDNSTKQVIFHTADIKWLEDAGDQFTFNQISSADFQKNFKNNPGYYPKNYHHQSAYWYKITVRYTEDISPSAVFEFFDQTIDHVSIYMPDEHGNYIKSTAGSAVPFSKRSFLHKNFEFPIEAKSAGVRTYYFKIKSKESINAIIVYRTIPYFIHYAITEYLTYGLFYGMILIFCFHNLLMFIAIRKREYLIYVLYILSIGVYEMCTDGIAFQFLWPNSPHWNQYAYGTALFCISIFALIFTRDLLRVKTQAPKLYNVLNYLIIARSVYFLFCLLFDKSLFYYKFIEFVPLFMAYYTGITIWRKGYKPARFFVLGYSVLLLGFLFKACTVLGYQLFFPGYIGHYSLSFSFIMEMVFLSFAIGDQVRVLRKEKEEAREEMIRQMNINSQLKDSINQELEIQVAKRTREVVEKSQEILEQAHIIEQQNLELVTINHQLEEQAAEISRMNVLLEKDNIQLKDNFEKATDALALSTELSFEEFSAKYPDQEKCNKFLAEIKWNKGFSCIKCNNKTYNTGRAPHSRRCTKCGYEESVLFNTIFQNSRIPINKAFYLVYLMYTSKGTISSYQLSEKLGIRQSTCWQYAIKVKKVMDDRKKGRRNNSQGWSKLIMAPLVKDTADK